MAGLGRNRLQDLVNVLRFEGRVHGPEQAQNVPQHYLVPAVLVEKGVEDCATQIRLREGLSDLRFGFTHRRISIQEQGVITL